METTSAHETANANIEANKEAIKLISNMKN